MNATEIVVTGISAGGISTILHADYFTDRYPRARVRAVADSGWYMDMPPFKNIVEGNVCTELALVLGVYEGFVPTRCAAQNPNSRWLCYCGVYSFPTMVTPLFVAEAQFDAQQLCDEDGLTCGSPATNETIAYVTKFGNTMRGDLEMVLQSPTAGLFSPSCFVHGINFNWVPIQNLSYQQTLHNWYYNVTGAPTKLLDDCGTLPCGTGPAKACPHYP